MAEHGGSVRVTDRFRVAVRLFGQHRELAGESVISIELAAGGTVADLRKTLAAHPDLGAALDGSAVALNRTYQPDESPVLEGDEVAVIPPVAGG
jgi:molybdopterin converting factor subunit 1